MADTDRVALQESPSLEELRAAARSALRRTRGFSPEQEAMFAGDGQTLRARLLEKWQRLLGPILQEGTSATQETQTPRGPASLVADIQDHEFGSGGRDRDKIGPLDRVRQMGIVRGTDYGSQRLATLRHRPREILLQIQKAAFVRQALPKEEEQEWARLAPPKRLWRMLRASTQSPPEVSLRDPGRVWKDFVACFPPETVCYQCEVGENLRLDDPEVLADLLLAAVRAMQEFAQPAQEQGQPLGYVQTSATRPTRIRPYRAGDEVPVLIYQEVGTWVQGALVRLQPGQESTFRSAVRETLSSRASWRELVTYDEALIAVNVTFPEQVGEGMFSHRAVASGFAAGRKAHPWLVFYNGRDTHGNLHLQASADHFACDGGLLALFIGGGEASGRSFEGVAGFYARETGQDLLAKKPGGPSGLAVHDYGQVAVAEMPRPTVRAGGDLYTMASLWAVGLYVNHMQEARGGIWRRLNPNTACNFTVTEKGNALRPLSVASCWLGSAEKCCADSPFHRYRHVLGLTAGLMGFKLGKELARGKKRLPEAMYWMSLLVHNRFPEWLDKITLRLNRSRALTDVRNHLFPPTVVYEREHAGLVHTTVAGTDLPNIVICDDPQDEQVTLTFSVAPDSLFISPGKLGPLVEWMAPAMQAFLQTVGRWEQDETGTLADLDRTIEVLYQEMKMELAARYSERGERRR